MNKPKILFISYSGPYPPNDGKRQRTFALLQALLSVYHVDYLIIGNKHDYEEAQQEREKENLRFLYVKSGKTQQDRLLDKIGFVFKKSPILEGAVETLISKNNYDFVFSRYIHPVCNIPFGIKIIVDIDDDFIEVYRSKIRNADSFWAKLRLWQILVVNVARYRSLLKKVCLPITVKTEIGIPKAFVLPNLPFQQIIGEDLPLKTSINPYLLYVGKLIYPPNVRGMIWFLREVWPELTLKNKCIKLTIISNESIVDQDLIKLITQSRKIDLKIKVEDLRSYYEESALIITPIFEGGGSNIKVAEALWMGRPVVTTSFGLRGYESFLGEDMLLVADGANRFSAEIQRIIYDKRSLVLIQRAIRSKAVTEFNLKSWREKFMSEISSVKDGKFD